MQSRYYNPEWGRFLNADAYASTGQGMLGNNMFAYCNNNPVNAKDPKGYVLVMVSISDDPMKDLFPELSGGVIFAAGAASSSTTVNLTAEKKAVKNFFNKVGNAIASGAESFWNGLLDSVEFQAQMQYQQDMAIRNAITGEFDRWANDPASAGDFAANLGSAVVWSVEGVAFVAGVSIPVVGQGILLVVGGLCLTWSTLRYYDVI